MNTTSEEGQKRVLKTLSKKWDREKQQKQVNLSAIKKTQFVGVRLSKTDKNILRAIKLKKGIKSDSEVIRQALISFYAKK